jgi:hypothetical protein
LWRSRRAAARFYSAGVVHFVLRRIEAKLLQHLGRALFT